MKRLSIITYMIFLGIVIYAQTTPEGFLGIMPATPQNCCLMKQSEKDLYWEKYTSFSDKINAEIDRRQEASEEYVNKNSGTIQAGAMKQAGYDEKTINQMKNATPGEREAMADRMMQEKYAVSMAEAQNFKNMTKEQQEAWAKTHSSKVMADVQANPEKYKTQNTRGKELMEVSQQITALNQKFAAKEKEFIQRINKLKNDPEAVKTRNEINILHNKWVSMVGIVSDSDAKKMDQIAAQIKSLKYQYCAKYSPQYIVIVNDYLSYVKASLPDYYKLEDLVEKQFQIQTGNKSPIGEKGLAGIEAVKKYSGISAGIFEFDLRSDAEIE